MNNKEMPVVLHWVNSAKGIGVVLVIVGHLLYSSNLQMLNKFIYAFHMPLFFILSGYVQGKITNNEYIVKKFRRILLPFINFAIIGFLSFGLLLLYKGNPLLVVLIDSFYVLGKISNHPLWFLIVLFETYFFCYLFKINSLNKKKINIWGTIAFALGGVLYSYPEIMVFSIFGFNRFVICLGFFMFGLFLRRINIEIRYPIMTLILMTGLTFCFGVILNDKISIYGFYLGNSYISFLVAAITGSLAFMCFCKTFLDFQGYFGNVSKYAILFLGTQYYWIIPFKKIMGLLGLAETWIYDILMLIFTGLYILFLPVIYRSVSQIIPLVKYLNGDESK